MADTYQCILCKKDRPGRFTRRREESDAGWSQRRHIPQWYCYPCLPAGQGRDETEETAVAKKKEALAAVVPLNVGKQSGELAKSEVLTALLPLTAQVANLVIEDADGLLFADNLLGRIRQARKGWGTIFSRIQERTIKPIRGGLEELYQLNRDVDGPAEKLEKAVKGKMDAYRMEEARLARVAEQEQQRLIAAADAKEKAAEDARTSQMRGKLQAQAAVLQQTAAAKIADTPMPVVGLHSASRTVEKWRVPDLMEFAKAVVRGDIPLDKLAVDIKAMDLWWKDDPDTVRQLDPVVEIYDDIKTVGR